MPHDHKDRPFDVGTPVRTLDGRAAYIVHGCCLTDRRLSRVESAQIAAAVDGDRVLFVHYWHEIELVNPDTGHVLMQTHAPWLAQTPPIQRATGEGGDNIVWGW